MFSNYRLKEKTTEKTLIIELEEIKCLPIKAAGIVKIVIKSVVTAQVDTSS